MTTRPQTRPAHDVEIVVETRGEVTSAAPDYVRAKFRSVLDTLDEPVLAARVKLTQEPDRAVAKPSIAQATIDVGGRPVRAQVAAATMREAVDLLQHRIRTRLDRLRHQWDRNRRHADARPIEAHHWAETRGHRPLRLVRDAQERHIVRHKSYSLARQTPWSAVFELETMDYDFHLFTDARTGCDSVVDRHPGAAYGLATTCAQPEPVVGLTVHPLPAPELTVDAAKDRLDLSGEPFVFFTNAATGRGNLLYHRFDGHYGLITPAES